MPGYDRDPDLPLDKTFDSVLPGVLETDAVDLLQEINPGGRLADLKTRAVHEICRA